MSRFVASARVLLARHRAEQDGVNAEVVRVPATATLDLHRALALETKSDARLIVPAHLSTADAESFDDLLWRQVAQAGVAVRRLFLLPYVGYRASVVAQRISLDQRDGVESRFLPVSRIPFQAKDLPLDGAWLLDGSAIVLGRRSGHDASGRVDVWSVSHRHEDIEAARRSWDLLWTLSEEFASGQATIDLEEPLVLSADLINGVAPILCTGDHVDPTGCGWYHGVWQYLRLIDMVSTPTWHAPFYARHIHELLTGRGNATTLITGTADYSMLAFVIDAALQANCQCDIHVLDLCPTPLFACKWYSRYSQTPITTHQRDLLTWRDSPDGQFDLVCTDAFLTRFDQQSARQVLAKWSELLRPSGRIITTVRIHDSSLHLRDDDEAIRSFRERALQRIGRWEAYLHKSVDDIATMAEKYARTMRSHPLGSINDVFGALAHARLKLLMHEIASVPGELYPTEYVRLVAEREGAR